MKTPYFTMTPDYSPVVRMMAMQTAFAVETTQKMFELAMLPWKGMPTPYGLMRAGLCVSNPAAVKAMPKAPSTVDQVVKEARRVADRAEAAIEAASDSAEVVTEKAEAATQTAAKTTASAAKKTLEASEASTKAVVEKTETAVKAQVEAVEEATDAVKAPAAPAKAAAKAADAAEAAVDATVAAMVEPMKLAAPEGTADDLTALNGVGPKLAEALNAQGIWHYKQIAGWTEANVAWVDENLPGVRGRASRNGWVGQATALDT